MPYEATRWLPSHDAVEMVPGFTIGPYDMYQLVTQKYRGLHCAHAWYLPVPPVPGPAACPVARDGSDVQGVRILRPRSPPMTTNRARFARISAAAIIAYQVLLLAAIFVRPELDPVHQPVSEYAIGRHGWVTVLAFLTATVSYGCLLVAVRPSVRGRAGRAGLALLGVCAVGTAGVGVFVADPVVTPPGQLTGAGVVHVVCGLTALVLLPVAALLLKVGARWTRWLPLAGLILHWTLSVVVPPEGWPPRLLFLTYAVWLLALTAHVRRGLS